MLSLAAFPNAAALLLVAAGAAKVVEPARTVGALRALGWPAAPLLVRVGAAVELLLGAAMLSVGGAWVAGLVAVSYLGFAVFVAAALREGAPIGSCGCFGQADTPPSGLHLAVVLVLAGGAAAGAVWANAALPDQGVLTWLVTLLLAGGAYVALTASRWWR